VEETAKGEKLGMGQMSQIQEKVDNLIMEIEELDNSIIKITSRRGMIPLDRVQYLKYRRCYLISELAKFVNCKEK